jgi:hypothetical protein
MVEDNREAEQRRFLQIKKQKLIEAANSLEELFRKYRMDEPDTSSDPMDEDPIERSSLHNHNYQPPFARTVSPDH